RRRFSYFASVEVVTVPSIRLCSSFPPIVEFSLSQQLDSTIARSERVGYTPEARVRHDEMGGSLMKEFKDRVTVVTGAASGIGRALADRFAAAGMKVVLADVEESALRQAEKEMQGNGATVLGVVTDVSKADSVEALAQKTIDTFGAVHIVCN